MWNGFEDSKINQSVLRFRDQGPGDGEAGELGTLCLAQLQHGRPHVCFMHSGLERVCSASTPAPNVRQRYSTPHPLCRRPHRAKPLTVTHSHNVNHPSRFECLPVHCIDLRAVPSRRTSRLSIT